ncbi:MAG TPA: hypothetical protein V6C65_18155 [Allocoleopsis sp.]
MVIPDNLTLSVEDIRYLRPIQFAQLTGIPSSSFCGWIRNRRISERNLERIADKLGMSKADLLQGLELRRQDVMDARTAQTKADRLIAFLTVTQEPA